MFLHVVSQATIASGGDRSTRARTSSPWWLGRAGERCVERSDRAAPRHRRRAEPRSVRTCGRTRVTACRRVVVGASGWHWRCTASRGKFPRPSCPRRRTRAGPDHFPRTQSRSGWTRVSPRPAPIPARQCEVSQRATSRPAHPRHWSTRSSRDRGRLSPAGAGGSRALDDAIPDADLVVLQGVGHVSNLEEPDRFNAAVPSFVRAVEGVS